MTLKKFYTEKLQQLKINKIPSPQLDLDLIFSEVLELERHQLISQDEMALNADNMLEISNMIDRRSSGEPLAYIFGYKHFYKDVFLVNKNVLVPRPETELIVEKSLELFSKGGEISILDMGCGSGCIGLSLAKEMPQASLVAMDICQKALEVTQENKQALHIQNKFNTIQADIKELGIDKFKSSFDLIVANPPYIDKKNGFIQKSVEDYEPSKALFSNDNGFEDIYSWTERASHWLRTGGYYIMEFGDQQCQEIEKYFENKQFFIEYSIYKDYSDLPRFVVAQKK